MITVSVTVEGAQPLHPGTAIVRVNGEVFAKLRVDESFELHVPDPTFTTTVVRPDPPVELDEEELVVRSMTVHLHERRACICDGFEVSCEEAGKDCKFAVDSRPCTCTLACTPQGITSDQHCRLR